MRRFLVLMLFIFVINNAYGFEIVYPKTKNVTKSSSTIFFIGSSKNPLKINGKTVPLHRTGAFAYFVKLPDSLNTFVFESEAQKEIYTIKKVQKSKSVLPKIVEYKENKYFTVTKNKTPLRVTPVNAGINRIAHLQQGVMLIADGEQGSFYRIKLSDTKKAWIDKNSVESTAPFKKAKLIKYNFKETEKNYIITFNLDKKVPYEITEGESIGLKFYNTENDSSFHFPYKIKTNSDKLYGYYGEYKDNDFILKIRKPPEISKKKPLKDIKITVDPGHGGKENGAIGCLGDKEKDIVLKISKYLEHELKSKGAKVVMTREHDKDLGLSDRVDIANNNDSLVFVSIHNNALPDTKDPNEHRGTSVYYYYNQSKPLAETILNTMVQELGTKNDNLHQQSFAVVRNTSALAILVEVAYLINPDDNEMLTDKEFQKRAAKSIANGIEKYFTK